MKDFNNILEVEKIDPQHTFASTEQFASQCIRAWNEVSSISSSHTFSPISQVIFCGMGASVYGALVIKALMESDLPFPVEIISDYHLPDYVSASTLVVLTSYSGTTEEVLSCAKEALQKGAQMLVLTKGGQLEEFAKAHNIPGYIFDGNMNPAGVPRLGNGYTIIGLLGLFAKYNLLPLESGEIFAAINRLGGKQEELRSKAKKDALLFENTIPIVIAAQHLSGNAQILRNQFNETSKTFSSYFLIPDLNHHLMEGLQFPMQAPLRFLIVTSKNYSEKITKRVLLTQEVIEKNGHTVDMITTTGQTVYDDILETIWYGSYLTFYLACIYDQNPAINPWVDYFKNELSK